MNIVFNRATGYAIHVRAITSKGKLMKKCTESSTTCRSSVWALTDFNRVAVAVFTSSFTAVASSLRSSAATRRAMVHPSNVQ